MPLVLNQPPAAPEPSGPAGFGGGPKPPTRSRTGSQGTRGARVVVIAILVCLATAGGVFLQKLAADGSPAAGDVIAESVARTAPGPAELGVCVDRSFGLHRLGSAVIREVHSTLRTYAAHPGPVLRSSPVPPVAALDVRVRIVRPDSYIVTDPLNAGVHIQVPGVPGLATAEPPLDAAPAAVDDYEGAYRDVTEARGDATSSVNRSGRPLLALTDVLSEGSDVSGCLFSLSRDAGGAPLSALVASDFGDTGLALADGTARSFTGDLSQVHLTVVAACTGADPVRCEQRYADFLERALELGLDPENVTRLGPGQATEAGDAWLATGLELATTSSPTTTSTRE